MVVTEPILQMSWLNQTPENWPPRAQLPRSGWAWLIGKAGCPQALVQWTRQRGSPEEEGQRAEALENGQFQYLRPLKTTG